MIAFTCWKLIRVRRARLPFVSKATGVPIARIAALVMAGKKLKDFDLPEELTVNRFFIKSPVFPFAKFPGVDPILESGNALDWRSDGCR